MKLHSNRSTRLFPRAARTGLAGRPTALGLLMLVGALSAAPAAAQLPNGGSVSESVSPAGDQDVWTFSASAGEGFQLQLADTGATALYPLMELYDPLGALLEVRWGTDVASITRTAATSGTHSVVVRDGNSNPIQTGAYELFFTRAPGANEGGALPSGGSFTDTITIGDLDSYSFTAGAGEGFQIQMGDLNATGLYPLIRLYDPNGTLLESRWNTGVASITRTAVTPGTYTVVLSDGNTHPNQTGAYQVFFTRAPGANEGGALPNGGSFTDTITIADLDSYSFTAGAGEGFQIQMGDLNATGLYPMIRLYDPSGTLLETRWNTGAASITRTAVAAGTYTVVLSDGNTHPNQTGAYQVFFTRAPGANEGGALPNGGSVTDTITIADLDSYSFTAGAGEGFLIQMADTNSTGLYPMMRLYDPNGTLIDTRWNTSVAAIVRTAAISGTYTLVASDGNTHPAQTGDYDLYFTLRPGANEGGTLPNGGVVSGSIVLGDLDSYTFEASAGEGFQLQMADVDGTALYPMIRLYDPNGALIETDWNTVVAAITRTATTAGTYTVVVSDGNTQPAQVGNYDLYFALAPGAEEGGALPNGGSVADTIDLGDLDSYTFTASAGQGFQLQMADLDSTPMYPFIRLYDPNGTLLQTNWNVEVATIVRTATTSGTYTVVCSDGNSQPAQTGAYEFHYTLAPGANEGGKLPNGGSVLDAITKGDLDSFTFAALAGEDFQLTLTDLNLTSLIARMRLYDPSGTLLQTASGGTTAAIFRTAAATGTYTVVVNDGNSQPAQTGSYELAFLRGLETYCTPGTSASGCSATISASGDPSASAPVGFVVQASNAEGSKDGLFFFGANGRQANPWGTGTSYQCVVPPVNRSQLLSGGGTNGACDGNFEFDFNALITAQPTKAPPSGAKVQIQCWFRDPLNTSNQSTSLSNALEFTLHP